MSLYGNEMDETVTALEAGLYRFLSLTKGPFVGSEALDAERKAGVRRRLVAFEVRDKGIARHGHAVLDNDEPCGVVTSGTQTPYLKKAIGMALVPSRMAAVGSPLIIDVRGRRLAAEIVPEPFYRRPKSPVSAGIRQES
jgi:aminomethyltransferase